ncbi:hypothetical protein Godav_024878 [Gossypium davidsonii]|uniref:Late embryogenesis abundant protein LEA-2 subgroup domain-containing protein n=2 Tax=Gossypium TaxID=3633 RepID=A0A7J8T8E6_GOSDV|nr:hypothetical protein [Gossypium davidsonii]MBA0657145.1 hypothetical protein [Gossypium klotzschianum]
MAEREQVKPFASVTLGGVRSSSSSDDDEALSMEMQLRKRRYIQCCGCIAALFLILAVVVLVLSFTVFRIGDPLIRLNSLTIQSLDISTNGSLKTHVNLTLLVDVSVKNPNAATFKFDNGSTTIYYGGRVVGEGVHFQEKIKPRRTLRRNVTVEIDPVKFVDVPDFITDLMVAKRLNVSSHTRISGRVNIMNLVKKHVVVKFSCSMTVRFPSIGFHGEKCKPELDF